MELVFDDLESNDLSNFTKTDSIESDYLCCAGNSAQKIIPSL